MTWAAGGDITALTEDEKMFMLDRVFEIMTDQGKKKESKRQLVTAILSQNESVNSIFEVDPLLITRNPAMVAPMVHTAARGNQGDKTDLTGTTQAINASTELFASGKQEIMTEGSNLEEQSIETPGAGMIKSKREGTGVNPPEKEVETTGVENRVDPMDALPNWMGKRVVRVSLMDQEKAASKARLNETEEQWKKLAEETQFLATNQTSLKQHITTLHDGQQQLCTKYNQLREEQQRSRANHERIHAKLFKELASIKQIPCAICTDHNGAKTSIPEAPMTKINPLVDDLDEHEEPNST